MHNHSTSSHFQSSARHPRQFTIGRLPIALVGSFWRVTSLLVLAVIGPAGAAAASPAISLTATHFEFGYPDPAFARFTHGFDYLSWSGPTISSLTAYRTIVGGSSVQILTTFSNPASSVSWATSPLPPGKIAAYTLIGHVGNTEYRSNTVWCGESLLNGGFRPELFGSMHWSQETSAPFIILASQILTVSIWGSWAA